MNNFLPTLKKDNCVILSPTLARLITVFYNSPTPLKSAVCIHLLQINERVTELSVKSDRNSFFKNKRDSLSRPTKLRLWPVIKQKSISILPL